MLEIRNLTDFEFNENEHLIISLYNQISKTDNISRIYRYFFSFYGIFLENKLIGMMTLNKIFKPYCKGNVLLVEDVSILEEYKGKGYGKLLIEYAKEHAKKEKCYKVILGCSDKNVGFYEKCGFKKSDNLMRYDL